MTHSRRLAIIGVLLGTVAAACKQRTEPTASPQPEQPSRPVVQDDAASPPMSGGADEEARLRREAVDRARAGLAEMIFFDFDQAEVRPEGRAVLDQKLEALQHSTTVHLRIAGHADERGSDEYNLALGMRRAAATVRYLAQRGIAPDRLEAVSFGEERPLDASHTESAWTRNRRAEFTVTRGDVLP